MRPIKRLLTIAGSDSGGGAGIQADLKTFSALGTYGMSVITAVTSQNSVTVDAVYPLPAELVAKQLVAVLSDFGADAIKIGMLFNPEIIETVATVLKRFEPLPIVLDPVMVAKSGDLLLETQAQEALLEKLVPLATLVTPNLLEAEVMTGLVLENQAVTIEAANVLLSRGAQAVLIKGGHGKGDTCRDLLQTHQSAPPTWYESARIIGKNTHGTGCTLSAAIAVGLARGLLLEEAVEQAREYLLGAIKAAQSMNLGRGHGPLHHFHQLWT